MGTPPRRAMTQSRNGRAGEGTAPIPYGCPARRTDGDRQSESGAMRLRHVQGEAARCPGRRAERTGHGCFGFSGRLPGKPTLFFKLSRQEIGCLFRACRIFMTRLLRKRGEKRQKNVVSRQGAGPRPEKREKPESLAAQERRGGGSRVPTLFFRKRAILVERLLRIKETEKDVGKVEESLTRKIERDKSRKNMLSFCENRAFYRAYDERHRVFAGGSCLLCVVPHGNLTMTEASDGVPAAGGTNPFSRGKRQTQLVL